MALRMGTRALLTEEVDGSKGALSNKEGTA